MAPALTPVVLEGDHVRLEPLTRQHVPALLTIAKGPRESFVYTLVPPDEAGMTAYVDDALRQQAEGRALPFATLARDSGAVVGSTRFLNVAFWTWPPGHPLQRGEHLPDVVEIGATWLAPAVQRSAINTEAKLLMLTHAFEVWRVHRVSLLTDARNTRSREAIARLGARPDGVLRGARVGTDVSVRDDAVYSILDAEWPGVKARLSAKRRPPHPGAPRSM